MTENDSRDASFEFVPKPEKDFSYAKVFSSLLYLQQKWKDAAVPNNNKKNLWNKNICLDLRTRTCCRQRLQVLWWLRAPFDPLIRCSSAAESLDSLLCRFHCSLLEMIEMKEQAPTM